MTRRTVRLSPPTKPSDPKFLDWLYQLYQRVIKPFPAGILQGDGTQDVTAITNSSTAGQVLRVTGTSTYAWGAVDLADSDAVTGILPLANGGTNSTDYRSDTVTFTNKTINSLTNYVDADAVHFKVYNNSGGALTVGTAVYAMQWNAGAGAFEVGKARANSASTMPAIGLIEDASIADGGTGEARAVGTLHNANTNAWSDGVALYVSAASAGALTTTPPVGVNIVQRIGTSVRQSATVGEIQVNVGTALDALVKTPLATGFSIAGGTTSKTLTVDTTISLLDEMSIARQF